MSAPSLMFKHTLDINKGWFSDAALDFTAKMSANVTIDPVYEGRVVHVNASGEFEMGVKLTKMPIFLTRPSYSPDVDADFVEETVGIAPTGVMTGVVGTGGYEMETTEFASDATYAPNNLLTADAANSTLATGGVIDNRNSSDTALTVPWAGGGTTVALCGVVSRGELTNHHRQSVVGFWPIYMPGTT